MSLTPAAASSTCLKGALPCPFCGSDRILEGYKYSAICVDCGATGPDKARAKDALKAWNTRVSPKPPFTTEPGDDALMT